MELFTTSNGIKILKCSPLNWKVCKVYAVAITEEQENAVIYTIDVGSLDDMWQCSYNPENGTVSFTSYHYSDYEVYRFKVDSFEQASEWVLRFAQGMGREDDLKDTIYTIKLTE